MEKKMIGKRILQVLGFTALLLSALWIFRETFFFESRDGIYHMKKFYEQEVDTVDVLVLGSSHAYTGVSTAELWDSYGMATYVLGGPQQSLWQSYYCLEEALKTQTPELIVLEGFMTTYEQNYQDSGRVISNTYGMNWSKTKLDAILASAPEEEKWSYLLEYVQYHARYGEITSADFLEDMGDRMLKHWKGYVSNEHTMGVGGIDESPVAESLNLTAKAEEYFRKMIELAQEKSIPICVMITPYTTISTEEKQIYNTVAAICVEYGVNYVNYNFKAQEIGMDVGTDFSDEVHLNSIGSKKFTKAFGAYLKEHYEISDRRGDEKWSSWQESADYLRRVERNKQLPQIATVEEAMRVIEEENYTAFISLSRAVDEPTMAELARLGGLEAYEVIDIRMMCYRNGEVYYMNNDVFAADESKRVMEIDERTVVFAKEYDSDGILANKIYIDGECVEMIRGGYNVVVYDEVTGTIVDRFGIWLPQPSQCTREL